MKKKSKIVLDDPRHIFIIAEAGSNWKAGTYQNDIKRATKLIKLAATAGANAIKFQTYNPNTVYVPAPSSADKLYFPPDFVTWMPQNPSPGENSPLIF